MKKTGIVLATALASSSVLAESAIDQFNTLGYGTLSGRLQTLSMYRDYDNGNNNYSTTLGIQLNYISPEMEGWSIGAAYNGAGVLDSMIDNEPNPGDRLIQNGRINVLNEAFLNYNMAALGLTNTSATVGRKINNGEVFRADDFRQKARSITAVQAESKDIDGLRIAGGHAFRMSNWLDANDWWNFNNFGDVFNTFGTPVPYDTDGVTWGEGAYTGIENLEIALFDAVAWDVANLVGTRAKYNITEETVFLAYLRHEYDVGRASGHDASVVGLSLVQKVGGITLEGGYFGVGGDTLRFQELTTGINHALGSSMMLYSGQFNGGGDTFYAKAVTKLEQTKTVLYGLYNYTQHDEGKSGMRHGQELNVVIKQPVPKIDNFTVALKVGMGYRDGIGGAADTFGTDTRLFVTYAF